MLALLVHTFMRGIEVITTGRGYELLTDGLTDTGLTVSIFFDGSAPIGQDQSEIGNDWTPMTLVVQ